MRAKTSVKHLSSKYLLSEAVIVVEILQHGRSWSVASRWQDMFMASHHCIWILNGCYSQHRVLQYEAISLTFEARNLIWAFAAVFPGIRYINDDTYFKAVAPK